MKQKATLIFFIPLFFLLLYFSSTFNITKKELSADSFSEVKLEDFQQLLLGDKKVFDTKIERIRNNWKANYTPLIIESIGIVNSSPKKIKLFSLLEEKTKQNFKFDLNKWYEWSWNQEITLPKFYSDFKAWLYKSIDPRFVSYFKNSPISTIRLDEVRWGGVRQDGIPPLRNPKMITAKNASYLADDNIVFGLSINGDSRAYPKRILAWHEMFTDTIGGVKITGVYCTLCGSMIAYKSVYKENYYNLGTSGFLYRSNKLMYDKKTSSLWNTIWGEPVIGELTNKNIKLDLRGVVTTTWGEWKKRHPQTQVLSLKTGHKRDYSEGAAYRKYFATDELMFTVQKKDTRLKNKDEVLVLRFDPQNKKTAISKAFLDKNPIYTGQNYLVLTDKSGANRVYEYDNKVKFKKWDQESKLLDQDGLEWSADEYELKSAKGDKLNRLPAHRAFWFGWFAAHPETILIK